MAIMRVLVLVLTMWITWFAIGNPVSAAPRRPPRPPPPPPPPPSLPTIATFDLNDPTTYPTFITNVRTKVADKTSEKCEIQQISKTLTQRYGYIELIATTTQKITLAIDMSNLYVLGYSDVINNKERAFFFKDTSDAVARNFFPGATGDNRKSLTYGGNYNDLAKYATRKNTPLGISQLEISIVNIYGKAEFETKQQVKFFLLAIQMVCEASKFKYICNKIPLNNYDKVTVDSHITSLENGWGVLSKAVYQSTSSPTTATKCALAPGTSPIILGPWELKNVEDIEKVVALLTSSKDYSISLPPSSCCVVLSN